MPMLTKAERDKFADYLEIEAVQDNLLAEQAETISPDMAKKLRVESMASKIVAAKLRAIETETI